MDRRLGILAVWLEAIASFAARAGEDGEAYIKKYLPLPDEVETERAQLLAAIKGNGPEILNIARNLAGNRKENKMSNSSLAAIFGKVKLADKGTAPEELFYPLERLDKDEAIFPLPVTRGSVAALWGQFTEALRELPLHSGFSLFLNSLISQIERHAWCLPADGNPEISLYDIHASQAAIAQAIWHGDSLILFGGDFSGIQNYIFGQGQADKNANKLLRARSFLLQAITSAIWLDILTQSKLEIVARIMDAGGRFTLLLPDTPQIRSTIATVKENLESWMLKFFLGAIKIKFAEIGLGQNDLEAARFSENMYKFNLQLEENKLRVFQSVFAKGKSCVFEQDYALYSRFGECEYCHIRPANFKKDEVASCKCCDELITHIGTRLPEANYLLFSRESDGRESDGVEIFDRIKIRLLKNEPDAVTSRKALNVVSIRSYDKYYVQPLGAHIPVIGKKELKVWEEEGRFQQGSAGPEFEDETLEEGKPKTFSLLAELARQAPARPGEPWRGLAALAICKADVDNLGLLTHAGLHGSNAGEFSLSRYAMWARMLNFFFAYHLMRRIEKEFANIYVIFAGGDDLFVLGPWTDIILFAKRLHEDFESFSGKNPSVTFSAGLPLLKPKLPMRAFREEAEGALEKAKEMPGKNAFTLFGVTTSWDNFNNLFEFAEKLENMCLSNSLSQGLTRRLLGYAKDAHKFWDGDMRCGLYLAHLEYDLARTGEGLGVEKGNILKRGQDAKSFSVTQISFSWALYRTRTS